LTRFTISKRSDRCPVCHTEGRRLYRFAADIDTNGGTVPGHVEHYVCPICHTEWDRPVPDDEEEPA